MIERAAMAAVQRAMGHARAARIANVYRNRIQPASDALTYRIDRRGTSSRERLGALRGSYAGKRCFVIGNGPSVAGMDLTPLRDEFTFGLNRGYLLFDRIGAPTTFLVAVNRHVVEQFGADLLAAPSTTFLSWKTRHHMPKDADLIFVRRARPYQFSADVAEHGAWEGATVTFVALQLAFHLGFEQVILIGVDHSFATAGAANKLVTATEADPNHFDPNYFGPGVKWQLPDLELSELAYEMARRAFVGAGRSVQDATVNGHLSIFPKVDFGSLFAAND